MPWSPLKVGRLTLTEHRRTTADDQVNATTGVRSVRLSGQESMPPLTRAQLIQRHEDMGGLYGSVQPIVFTDKPELSAFYRVTDQGSSLLADSERATAGWNLSLERIGSEHEVDFETRLSGAQSRANDFSLVGERIVVPPLGSYGFTAGNTVLPQLTRTGEDGAITAYRGVPLGTHPRWSASPAAYLGGRVRFLDGDGLERVGSPTIPPASWTLSNGLVRVVPSVGKLEVSAYTGGAWRPKTWQVMVGGALVGTLVGVTLLRNDPELVVARLTYTAAGPGRTSVDLSLRRGSRFVEVWVEAQTSSTVRVQLATAEAGTAETGRVRATANDAAGNRYVIGSARTASTDLTAGALFKASVTSMGVFLGVAAGGSAAVSGDAPADLMAQYIGAPAERVEAVPR